MSEVFNRRAFLLAAAGGMLAAGPAVALTLEDDPARARLYLSACEARSAHDAEIQRLVALIEGDAATPPETHQAVVERVKALRCAVCGCALGAIEPYPARF